MSWFIKDSDTKHVSALLNYLTDKVKVYSSRSGSLDSATLTEFEDMVIEIIPRIKDPELIRTLKECGWTGTRFEAIQNGKWDVEYVIQMLSNYYLKSSMNHTQSAYNMNTMHSTMSQKQQQQRNAIDNIMPFCPDIVVDMIMERDCQIKKPFAQVFKGVCLLADISGFSKYSGEMCSKGVSGLDELRSVTNGLLDNFVETVYKYGGDGKY
ncbi:hypothetical protein EON65_27225 [archaeon]|nr:MAG: hypothetical protein EON65_27225 [archaeon]